jgi:peptidyl-prolyl cis-trans isomerase A (cyclophilin A)
MFFKSNPIFLASALFVLLSFNVQSTIVEIRTSLGIVEVNLFDNTTPETVANFLSYTNSGSYADSVVHRSVSNFIIQGGGFTYTGPVAVNSFSLDSLPTGTPITNDPKLSNLRGTIAMAKTSDPDSATSQWFINLSNNSSSLDVVSNAGGFTVFGQVVGDGMQVIDAIAALTRFNGGSAFSELPIRDYTQTDVDNDVAITDENLVIISDIVITNPAVDTAANLNPVANTLGNSPTSGGGGSDSSGGGGAFGWLLLIGLGMLQIKRQLKI